MYEHLHFINDAFAINVGTQWSSTNHLTSNGELTFATFSYLSKHDYFINKGLPYKFEKFGFYT